MNKLFLTALLASAALLSGCLLPEKFDAKIEVNADASYRFKYSGTAAHALAVMQIASTKKPLSAPAEAELKQEATNMAKIKGVTKASYIGNGRFQLEIDSIQAAGSTLDLLSIFKVSTDKEGVMTISTPPYTDNDREKLAKLGLSMNGTLDLTLPKNAEVISSNTTSSPRFFGLIGGYSWKIGGPETRPLMKIRFKK